MADRKYGRLYTEDDMRRIVAMERRPYVARESPFEQLVALVETEGQLTFPLDEPLFLLRGQDEAAATTLDVDPVTGESNDYYTNAEFAGASAVHLLGIKEAAADFREYRRSHAIKVPD